MDKETLSNYGWIVICVLVLAVMLALATPFGAFIADGFKATYTGLFQTGDNAMDVVMNATGGCTHKETEVKNVTADYSGDTVCKKCGTVLENGKHLIPSGGTYYVGVTSIKTGDYTGATATYNAGDAFPETVNTGDVYVFGDYEYRYNYCYSYTGTKWTVNETQNGWGVRMLDSNKTSCQPILEVVNNKPITSLQATFRRCNIRVAPEIPNTVTNMLSTFDSCTSLTTAPIIPNGVTQMRYIFQSCKSLKTYQGSTDPDGDFSGYVVPSGVIIDTGFAGCELLTVAPTTINSSLYQTFMGCTSLKTAPNFGENVSKIWGTFQDCTSLESIRISPNITSLSGDAFYGCKSLTNITINSKLRQIYETAFTGCTSLTSINFEGTMAQWNAIEFRSSSWNIDIPATYVQCSDGQVPLS